MSTGTTAIQDVQTAAMAALAADSTFMALVPGGVWDYVPADPTWPYVCLEAASERPMDGLGSALGSQGREVELTFAIFSAYQGRKEQSAILDRLVAVLRHTSLTVTGWAHHMTDFAGADQFSMFEVGNVRAGSTQARMTVYVTEA